MSYKKIKGDLASNAKAVFTALPAIYSEYIENHKDDEPPADDFLSFVSGKNRHTPYPAVRKTIRYIAWSEYNLNEDAIGTIFNCDRSTIYHSVSEIRSANQMYPEQKALTAEIKKLFEKHVKI